MLVLFFFSLNASATDWSQPPLGCVEEIILQPPQVPCLDLTQVKNPSRDFPADLTPEEIQLWNGKLARTLSVCRSLEVLRREELNPGSMNALAVEIAWMTRLGIADSRLKVESIYDASEKHEMPPQILVGSLTQESLMADLGISEDGGNYSCGIGQLNLLEWCRYANQLPPALKKEMEWPHLDCSVLSTRLLKPFYEIGLRELGSLPEYRLRPEHFAKITLDEVVGSFPEAPAEIQKKRFEAARSFSAHCSDYRYGIPAKAFTLRKIFDEDLPSAVKKVQRYPEGQTFLRSCQRPYRSPFFPAHPAWLLADAIYNAGDVVVTAVEHYYSMTPQTAADPISWSELKPKQLISTLYWSGRYNPETNVIEFRDLNLNKRTMTWYKECVVQRHIARVIQHATLPEHVLVESLEGSAGCKKESIPLVRQQSSGKL